MGVRIVLPCHKVVGGTDISVTDTGTEYIIDYTGSSGVNRVVFSQEIRLDGILRICEEDWQENPSAVISCSNFRDGQSVQLTLRQNTTYPVCKQFYLTYDWKAVEGGVDLWIWLWGDLPAWERFNCSVLVTEVQECIEDE
jgi:hypothetical protein